MEVVSTATLHEGRTNISGTFWIPLNSFRNTANSICLGWYRMKRLSRDRNEICMQIICKMREFVVEIQGLASINSFDMI